jgi:alpha-L-arabinofuranosidase
MKKKYISRIVCCVIVVLAVQAEAQLQISIDTAKPKAGINPAMWGLFFEDINFGADGGLYAELVKNRSFEFPNAMEGWSKIQKKDARGLLSIRDESAFGGFEQANPHYLRMEVKNAGDGFGVSSEGFRGIGIRKREKYYFSVYARSLLPGPMTLRVEVVGSDGKKLAEAKIADIVGEWKNYYVLLTASDTNAKAKLNLLATAPGLVDVDMVSLFPEDSAAKSKEITIHAIDLEATTNSGGAGNWSQDASQRPIPGLRKDLVQMLADLKPGFLRFPGGCIVEGRDIDNRYQWKNTIGDINRRKLIISRWNNEFEHRFTPDYFQSFGLGFYEFFLLCEQIGAEPMPIINCGMACQFNTGQLVPMDKLQPYLQDALDLIDFANGPVTTEWGKRRAEMGHPEPFNMKMLGVGNEQWGPQYIERYKVFAKTIKEKDPNIKLISGTGSDPTIFPNGPAEVKYLWAELRKLKADIVDEHYYRDPNWFVNNTGFYDNYDRKGPKVFVGEYAAQSVGVASPDNRNNWQCALSEAAFMTGLERNADVVVMTSYAPLFGQLDGWQWTPNLIWFDNVDVYGTANYYVQQMFSLNRGDRLLTVQVGGQAKNVFFVSSSLDEKNGDVIIKAVNATANTLDAVIDLQGAGRVGPAAKVTVLAADKMTDENSLGNPKKVYPAESSLTLSGSTFSYKFKPYSLTVLRIPLKR